MSMPESKLNTERHEKSTAHTDVETSEDSSSDTKSLVKTSSNQLYLDVPLQSAFARSSETISDVSVNSFDSGVGRRTSSLPSLSPRHRLPSRSSARLVTWRGRLQVVWSRNKGLALVTLAQLFGVMMNVTTRLLEMDGPHGEGMHPFQILFARMIGTLILSCAYQWLAKIESAPFGPREVLKLLIARGVGGFFGVYGMYCELRYIPFTFEFDMALIGFSKDSLQYLPLSDATVITFLAPTVACWACSFLIHEPFTRSEQIGALISFIGVVLIARPTSLLPGHSTALPAASGAGDGIPATNATQPADLQGLANVTPAEHLSGVGLALVGVVGAAIAYTTIRWIGKRAHPLISVNYFAAWSSIVSTVALLAMPGIGFRLPESPRQWVYLLFLGICGFVMQFLLTAGLQHEKSSRATNMVYTQMLFALAFDKLVWNTTPGALSIVGSSLILGSALYNAVYNSNDQKAVKGREAGGDEELGLVTSEDDNEGSGPLRGVQEVQLRTLRV